MFLLAPFRIEKESHNRIFDLELINVEIKGLLFMNNAFTFIKGFEKEL